MNPSFDARPSLVATCCSTGSPKLSEWNACQISTTQFTNPFATRHPLLTFRPQVRVQAIGHACPHQCLLGNQFWAQTKECPVDTVKIIKKTKGLVSIISMVCMDILELVVSSCSWSLGILSQNWAKNSRRNDRFPSERSTLCGAVHMRFARHHSNQVC